MANISQNRENSKTTLMKKQWSKYVSKGIALSLMNYNPESPLLKSYKNTSYCAEIITTNEVGRTKTTYCKNRWCIVCNRIKTAMAINGYLHELQALHEPVFVTLTLPTCRAAKLAERIDYMEATWRTIANLSTKAKFRREYRLFKGIRKAECTIRPYGFYHYHFHVIMSGRKEGEWLIDEWLRRNGNARRCSQDIQDADEKSYRELFKYAFKAEIKTSNQINARRYDFVFNSLYKKRTHQPFGGIRKLKEDFDDDDLTNGIILENLKEKIFKWVQNDWYDKQTGEPLVGLALPEKVKDLVAYPPKK